MAEVIKTQIIRSRRRSMGMSISPDGALVVKAPLFTPKYFIDRFIKEHDAWIKKQLERLQKHPVIGKRKYEEGEAFLYLGKQYRLTIGDYPEIAFRNDRLLFPAFMQFRIEKELHAWYRKQAQEVIISLLKSYSVQMKTSYTGLTFSDTSSKWGTCFHDNRLQFCWRLIMAPRLVITYVVVHELAHTMEKNHSAGFWRKVRFFNPSYRQNQKWLKEHGHTLVL